MSDERPLASIQEWMQNALIFPEADVQGISDIVEPSDRLTAAERLGIYQRSYYRRLLRCMREQFPALCHALGADLFDDFAREYLRSYPSDSHTLYELGRRFPGYLQETRPDADAPRSEPWVDFMVDLARFEREVFVLFDAPGHEGRPFAAVEDPDTLLALQPCFALGRYRFPVALYYHGVREGTAPGLPPAEESMVAMVRTDYVTHTYSLTMPHYVFLAALKRGLSVAKALRHVSRELGLPLQQVVDSWSSDAGVRRRWIEAGFFVVGQRHGALGMVD